jgi:hypothetical protein
MNGWRRTVVALGCLMAGTALAGAPGVPAAAPAEPAATQPTRTKFENGEPINDYFTSLAVKFGVMVVQGKPVDAYMLRDLEMPEKLEDALKVMRQTLEPQGYSVLQSLSNKRLVLRVLPSTDARKFELSQSPVTFGTAGEAIDVSDPERQVTHVLPISHVDMLETLQRTSTQDREVSAEVAGGGTIGVDLILTGPALKVQRAVEAVAKLDKTMGGAIIARTLTLKYLDAQATADALNAGFSRDPAPMKAVVDARTNSIVITGPEELVMEVMVALIGQEAKRGPVVPRPNVEPPPTLPILPPSVPSSSPVDRGGAMGGQVPRSLDESVAGGDNAGPGVAATAGRVRSSFSPNVKEGVFL